MLLKFVNLVFFLLLVLLGGSIVSAQADASTRDGRPNPYQEDLPLPVKETLAKQRIKKEEKEYQELVGRAEQANMLAEELNKSFEGNSEISSLDAKKIERLAKIIKRIHKDLGGTDRKDSTEGDPIFNLKEAFSNLQTNASKLHSELKKSTRYSVSVEAIERANSLLQIVEFIKFGGN